MRRTFSHPLRAFPDGKQAAAIGNLIGQGHSAGQGLFLLDLDSGGVRRLPPAVRDESTYRAIGVSRDSRTILVSSISGDSHFVTSIPVSGRSASRTLFSLTTGVWSIDTGPDGAIYVDQIDRPMELLRFAIKGGRPEKIASFTALEGSNNFAVLPYGRAVLAERTGGRWRLMVATAGKDATPLVNTSEETTPPVTPAGPLEVAFLIGPEPRRTIALASSSNGRVTRRIPFDKGPVLSLAGAPDGNTLYAGAGGSIWAIPVGGGEPRKLRAGDAVLVEPDGRHLIVQLREHPKMRLVRVPVNGGPEMEIPQSGPFRLGNSINSTALDKNGLLATPLALTDSWFWLPGVLDTATGKMTRIPLDYLTDFHFLDWAPDGRMMALAVGLRSAMWKFQQEPK